MSTSPPAAISATGLRKSFGDHVVLREVDLTIEPGECVVLIGASGSGKSTLLRCVNLLEVVDDGVISFEGRDITDPRVDGDEVRSRMGMVFQAYSLFPNLTARDNVGFGLRLRKTSKAEERRRADELLDLVGLGSQAGKYPHQMSGGQQQRVALARALAIQPRVLLLDEPLSALDAQVRVQLREEIRRIQTELAITTLFVTHDQEEALAISDRVGVMSRRRL